MELVAVDSPVPGRLVLREGSQVLGRSRDADLQLDVAEVSRMHARILRRGATVTVEDLESANGTLLNGQPVRGAVPLQVGDRLGIGPVTLELRGDAVDAAHEPTRPRQAETYRLSEDADGGALPPAAAAGDADSWSEPRPSAGPGGVLVAVGLLLVVAGFGLWMAFIANALSLAESGGNPLSDGRRILGLPLPVLGLVLLAAGGLVAGIGRRSSRTRRR